jgi:septal ring factor EnvC (AmiA/AmiB activator)
MTSGNNAFGINTIEEEESEENDEVTNKVVKFAQDEAEKYDAQRDKERSRQELLSKIARLTDTLTDAQKQIQIEKDKRKKKEKSLLKLAKELKKRNVVREKEEDRLEEVCRGKCIVERLIVKNECILELYYLKSNPAK